jgi:hypothetical protein
MASQGSKIYANDYNIIQSAIATVLGTGSGSFGYGQTIYSTQIIGTPNITATQWLNLRRDLISAYTHQNSPGSLSIPSSPVVGGEVTYSDYAKYLAISNACTANTLVTPPAGQASTATFSTGSRTTVWNGSVSHTVVLTFTNSAQARYYFNAGGTVTFQASLIDYPGFPGYGSADTSYSKNSDWNTLLTNLGVITFNYGHTISSNPGGSNQTILSNVGYYQLTTSQQNIYRKITSSSTYTPNQYDIYAQIDSTGSVLTFTIQFQDLSTAHPGNPYSNDWNVEGTLTSLVQGYYATGSYVSVTPPSVNNANPIIS